ncbi:hypothetical protein B484DRAFT_412346 [Ochromonadaceae sp. CCMP2298]|nr:hypothetical protein B484DRAFT_412346 [Ochromonadaceae sp. CCMP2298]
MLKHEPKRAHLKHMRDRTSHRGADWSYKPPPLSILNAEPYDPKQGGLGRETHPEKFITHTMALAAQAKEATKTMAMNKDSSDLSLASSLDEKDTPSRVTGLKPLDFTRFIHKDAFNSKLMSMVARRKHPPQDRDSGECKGPKWDGAESK